MSSLAQVARAMQQVVTEVAEEEGRNCGFVRRRRRWSGASFVQTLVLGWLGEPGASLSALTQIAAKLGVEVSPQGLAQRFGPAALLERVLAAAIGQVVAAAAVPVPLLGRFTEVLLLDSSSVALPDGLASVWAGCGGRVEQGAAAALKVTVRLDLRTGRLDGPALTAGRAQDKSNPWQHEEVRPGGLRIADLGYWSLAVLGRLSARGAYWLSHLSPPTIVRGRDGARLDLPAWLARQGATVDEAVSLGGAARLPARLLGARVPVEVAAERRRKLRAAAARDGKTPPAARLALADWTLLVTNAPGERLSVTEALVLARARWQIELLFKLWKSHGRLASSRAAAPWRVLCEVYAKLTALVIQHWVVVTGGWERVDRSLTEAAATIRRETAGLISALGHPRRMIAWLKMIRVCLAAGCRVQPRKTKPSAYQLWLDPILIGLN
jgi:hypothetical protein